jgi:D-galactose 1-dehydrogenase
MPPIRLALIGLGKIARDQHLSAIECTGHFALAATVDGLRTGIGSTPHFASLEALLDQGPEIDAVTLCTPPQVRAQLAAVALARNLHVFLEKPPAASLSEAEVLRDQAQARGITLFAAWHSRYAPGVKPARAWLTGKRIKAVSVIWHEDVREWHPGQAWIWQAGGFGVFDPGINALSILTHILPAPLALTWAKLAFPENCEAPIAARMQMRDKFETPISLDFDFRRTGVPRWDIVVETDEGHLTLRRGGTILSLPSGHEEGEAREYAALYARFAELIRTRRSDVDLAPLKLVADALRGAEREIVEAFLDHSN